MKALIIALMLMTIMPACRADMSAEQMPDLKPPRKIGFKYRHPKMYAGFRKVRHVCVLVAPVVNVTANVFTAVGVFF